MVADELDAVRARFGACETIAYADLSAKMVLVTNSKTPMRREELDRLCGEAAVAFGAVEGSGLSFQHADVALIGTAGATKIFIRDQQEPNDLLCCVCAAGFDVAPFIPEARDCLRRISGED